MKKLTISRSNELWERAIKVIPSGTQTLSKGPDQFIRGVSPKYLVKGKGCHVWDIDGNEFIDYPMALGPILLGYDYPAVTKAAIKQIHMGTAFTLMHPVEVELAELLTEVIPCAEMVRFGKNGVDATSAAIRCARAYTGKDHIAYCGYHGYQDWYCAIHVRNKGVPVILRDFMHEFKYNDISSLERLFNENHGKIGAVIMEQPGTEPQNNFLQKVKDVAHKNNAVFIMDEIVTGFRYSLGGAQELYKVVPDLAAFGKGMANGFPLSAVVGKKEIMKTFDEIFFSTTYGGETVSIAASIATIKTMRKKDVVGHIWKQGKKLRNGLCKIIEGLKIDLKISGNPPRSGFEFQEQKGISASQIKSLFLQETIKRGVLFGGPVFITFSHKDKDIQKTLDASHNALNVVKKALDENNIAKYMEGEFIGDIFRKRD
ncbi:MAG: aminotransferase class III-fold pyridoxal phosphate-dependent enzyme [bacterium]